MKNLCLSITIMLSMICNLATAVPAQVKLSDFNPRKNDATPAIHIVSQIVFAGSWKQF